MRRLTRGQGHGDRWRRYRRAAHSKLQPKAASTYEEKQRALASQVLADIIADPDEHQEHILVYTASLAMNIACAASTQPLSCERADADQMASPVARPIVTLT